MPVESCNHKMEVFLGTAPTHVDLCLREILLHSCKTARVCVTRYRNPKLICVIIHRDRECIGDNTLDNWLSC